jgi:plastocyanin
MRTLVLALCATLVLTVAACGDASSPSPGDTAPASPTEAAASPGEPAATDAACATASAVAVEVDVTIADFAYDPEPVNVTIGQVVGWTNEDAAPHTATLDDGSCGTGTIQGGSSAQLVFNEPGTFTYHCNIHPAQMAGYTIVVS